jgi:hypothetical protein
LRNPVYLGQVYAYRTFSRPARQRQSPLKSVGRQGTTLEQLSLCLSRQGVSSVGEPGDRVSRGDRIKRQPHRLP